MLTVALALAAALSYGAGDFLGGLGTRRASIYAIVVPVQIVGLALFMPLAPLFGMHWSVRALEYGALAGLCGSGGIALLYHALSVGKMGIVSPITAILAASLPVVAGTLRGEHLSVLNTAGIGVALAAIVLVSASGSGFSSQGVKEAFGSGVLLGGFYVFLALAGHTDGVLPLIAARAASTLFLLLLALGLRRPFIPPRGLWTLVIVTGVFDMGANALYVAAAATGYLSIAAVLTSLYPASTVLLARIFLNERLGRMQIAGVALALAGVALISV